MDFQTMLGKFSQNSYRHAQDFLEDMKLVFSNAEEYNQQGSTVLSCMVKTEQTFTELLQKLLPGLSYLRRRSRKRVSQAPATSEEEREEEEEDEEEEDEEEEEEPKKKMHNGKSNRKKARNGRGRRAEESESEDNDEEEEEDDDDGELGIEIEVSVDEPLEEDIDAEQAAMSQSPSSSPEELGQNQSKPVYQRLRPRRLQEVEHREAHFVWWSESPGLSEI